MTDARFDDDLRNLADDDAGTQGRAGSIWGRILGLIALGSMVTYVWQRVRSSRERLAATRSAPLPERLQTWEGEGGRPDPEPISGSVHSPAAGRTIGTAAPTANGVQASST